jgi:hypothetical protein
VGVEHDRPTVLPERVLDELFESSVVGTVPALEERLPLRGVEGPAQRAARRCVGVHRSHAGRGHRLLRVVLEAFDIHDQPAHGRPCHPHCGRLRPEQIDRVVIGHAQDLTPQFPVIQQELLPYVRGNVRGVVRKVQHGPMGITGSHWGAVARASPNSAKNVWAVVLSTLGALQSRRKKPKGGRSDF